HTSSLPSSPPHQHLHTFPTRRSSDLRSQKKQVDMPNPNIVTLPEYRTANTRPSSSRWRLLATKHSVPGACVGAADTECFVARSRSEEHTSELQSRFDLVCRLLLEKKK